MSTSPSSAPQPTDSASHAAWQGSRPNGGNLWGQMRRRAIQVLWGALLFAALMLFAWLVWLLLLAPKRTPVVVLSAAPYSWPLPPNAWAAEDFENLAVMDGQTISLRGVDDPIIAGTDLLDRIEQEVQGHQQHHSRSPLVLWISLHGVADVDSETAYLIPPGGTATDPESWVDFNDLLDRLEKTGRDQNTLLILDCHRMQVNWNIGLLANQLTTRVESLVQKRNAASPNAGTLAVLMSAGRDQVAMVSPDLGGSVFGHYLQLGLAGAADRDTNSGNQNGWIELIELHRYVHDQVLWWTGHSRGESQTTVLVAPDPSTDFRVAKCLNAQTVDQLVDQQSKLKRPAATIAAGQLDGLWQSLDEFRELRLYQREPIEFRNLEHSLLWLEQLSTSGRGYRTLALRTLDDVEGEINAIKSRQSALLQRRTFSAAYSVLSGTPPAAPRSLAVHSLALSEYFGTQDVSTNIELRDQWSEIADQPTPAVLNQTLATLQKNSKSELASTQFLTMVGRYQIPSLWQNPGQLGELLGTQAKIEDFAVPRDGNRIPDDLRVHRWNQQLLASVDTARRDAEDRVFLQYQSGFAKALIQTQQRLSDSIDAANSVGRSMKLCDQAMAQAAYQAQWITHPRRHADATVTRAIVDDQLLPLIANTQELANRLADLPTESSAQDLSATNAAITQIEDFGSDNVRSILTALETDRIDRQRELIDQSETNQLQTIGEIEALLSVPLVDWESRRELRSGLDRLLVRIQQNFDPPRDDAIIAETDDIENPYSAEIQSWQSHPLDRLLQLSEKTSLQSGNRVQQFIDDVGTQLASIGNEPTLQAQRDVCSVAARRVRAASPIWFPAMASDPIIELRQLDLQSFLLWNAQRALADFWGPAGQRRSFYDLSANDYCDAVVEIHDQQSQQNTPRSIPIEVQDLRSRMDAIRSGLPGWLATSSDPTIQLDPFDTVESRFNITSAAQASFVPPAGTAMIVVREGDQRVGMESIEPSDAVALPTSDASYQVTLPAEIAKSESRVEAQTIFRGHEYSTPLDLQQLGGVAVDVRPYQYRYSEVTLNSPWDKLSVAFVVDCSASMKESLVGSGDDPAAASKIQIAKSALQEMLFSLAMRPNVRVGVQAFGNRLGWSVDEPLRALARPDFIGTINPQLSPSQDVQSLLPLGDYDVAIAQSVIPEVGSLQPWGQSPLYLSVMQSINEFGSDDVNADRHVIVITDGANYQFIPTSAGNIQATTGDDIRNAWAQQEVPVHILGLGMDRSEQPNAVAEFSQLCLDTGGKFQSLSGTTDLAQALRELLAPAMYRVSPPAGDIRPEQRAELGTPIRIAPVAARPEPYALHFDGEQLMDSSSGESVLAPASEEVVLQGGESIQLYVNPPGTEIYAYPYQENVAASAQMVTAGGMPTDYIVRVHRPDHDHQHQVTFRISWQRHDRAIDDPHWRVSRRPESVWIEIQPLDSAGHLVGELYAFMDANYEPEQPVPLVNLIAADWPETASRARVRVWSQPPSQATTFELLPPALEQTETAGVEGIEQSVAINDALYLPTAITTGIHLRIDPTPDDGLDGLIRRRFVVRFDDPDQPVTSLKLALPDSGKKGLTRIVRQFDSQRQLAVHTFYFDSTIAAFPGEIIVSNQTHQIEGAWEMDPEYVEISIPGVAGLLPVGQVLKK
ncbi:VWA domain-containing protein [Stieleria sp. TO1_6]|uniref:vWA domain-containing protein n=1 Tax=Stieleria tagensis TaxID=2956795 RepID=UPI00209A8CE5|nr:vWA domain-containing protein [Stieleria tagensis]MCO8120435.1 VWA domain-containing protein [Stieleria tagensis]